MGSAALAPPQVVDVTLSLFGGRKTDIAPSDCPEGITPDEQDGVYVPGGWFSRPGLSKLYTTGELTAGSQVLYEKSYIQPNNDPLTLVLTSDGKLWVEDVGNSPGTLASLFNVTPGLYAQSVSADGREYIAFSDLLHGQGVPLQYDGTNLDRVTMDGPGAAPSFADAAPPNITIKNSPNGLFVDSFPVNIDSISQEGNVCTALCDGTFLQGNSIQVGDQIVLAGVGVGGYNGTFELINLAGDSFQFVNGTTGLAPSSGGTATAYLIQVLANPTVGAFTAGRMATIAGAGVAGYDGTYQIRGTFTTILVHTQVFLPANAAQIGLANSGGGTITQQGLISQGNHQAVVMFLTRQGYVTAPSPIANWVAGGNNLVAITNIPTGPANVVARVLGFTGAGGDNFFTLPASVNLPSIEGPIVIAATVIPDNTTTSATLEFSDNALFNGVAIDQIGNDLFDQRVLGPMLGFFSYASRLMCWGDYQKIENLLNMGFCGGPTGATPLGWTVTGGISGGAVIAGGSWPSGQSWQITGDGSGNPKGQITQSSYQDDSGTSILLPSTSYILRLWAQAPAPLAAGNIIVDFYSAGGGGVLLTAQIPCANATALGSFLQANFSAKTPAVIPTDTVIRVYEVGVANAAVINIGEVEAVYAQNPYNNVLVRASYALNPEAFAQSTGNLGASDDDSAVQCLALLRETSLLETLEGVHDFIDNNSEPDTWQVNSKTRACGAVSLRGGDPGKFGTGDAAEDWAVVASKNGVYLFAGGEFWKVSQEISRGDLPQSEDPRPCWDDINWTAQQTIVAKNDPSVRRAYFAVPLNGATQPNYIFVLDYREMDTATQIAAAPPVHITIQGKMKSSDLTRKWSVWNVSANDLEILVRPGNQRQLYFAGGARNNTAYGNLYSLDPTKLTDDDYGQIFPYYTTYAFTDHDQEQALGLGSGLHLYKNLHAFVAGVGWVTITPIVNSLYNFQPNLKLQQLSLDQNAGNFLASDLEWTSVGITGQRVFFRIAVQPLFPTTTDVQIRLQKFVVGVMKHPVAQFRQSGV